MAVTEKQIAGASYIIAFYKEVQALTHNYGNYLNLMLEIENRYGTDAKGIEPEVNNQLSLTIQTVRLSIHKSFVMYCSIKEAITEKEEKGNKQKTEKLNKAYSKLKTEFVLDRDSLETYVIALNSALVNDIIQNLLTSSQDLVSEVYNHA